MQSWMDDLYLGLAMSEDSYHWPASTDRIYIAARVGILRQLEQNTWPEDQLSKVELQPILKVFFLLECQRPPNAYLKIS